MEQSVIQPLLIVVSLSDSSRRSAIGTFSVLGSLRSFAERSSVHARISLILVRRACFIACTRDLSAIAFHRFSSFCRSTYPTAQSRPSASSSQRTLMTETRIGCYRFSLSATRKETTRGNLPAGEAPCPWRLRPSTCRTPFLALSYEVVGRPLLLYQVILDRSPPASQLVVRATTRCYGLTYHFSTAQNEEFQVHQARSRDSSATIRGLPRRD